MSRYPFYDYFSEILEDLYCASTHHVIDVIEAYINKLVLEVNKLVYHTYFLVSCTSTWPSQSKV